MLDLKDTVDRMLSDDYKERFKAEFSQTNIRYNKLRRMVARYEAGKLSFEPKCSIDILKSQLAAMGQYLYFLEVRAFVEDIEIEEG